MSISFDTTLKNNTFLQWMRTLLCVVSSMEMSLENFRLSGKNIKRVEKEFLASHGKKWCSKCKSIKEPHDFYKNTRFCKICVNICREDWARRHPNYKKENKERDKRKEITKKTLPSGSAFFYFTNASL